MHKRNTLIIFSLFLIILLGACNMPTPTEEEESAIDIVITRAAETLTAQAALAPEPTSTPAPEVSPTSTPTPTEALPTSTPLNPLVLETTLCWKGPGAQYEVVSALQKDQRVELIGQGSISGWWIVDNPIYHDPCWAQANTLQLDTGYNTAALAIFTPPPTPTSTPPNTATPTPTDTP